MNVFFFFRFFFSFQIKGRGWIGVVFSVVDRGIVGSGERGWNPVGGDCLCTK